MILFQNNFPDNFYRTLVNAIISGNEEYLDQYKYYQRELENSDGFWNMRRCIIEGLIGQKVLGLEFEHKRYGGAGHLLYSYEYGGVTKRFIIQNGATFDSFNPKCSKRGSELKERKYMNEYIDKNKGIEFLKQNQEVQGEWDFLNNDVTFNSNKADEYINETEEFYIITYLVDSSIGNIHGIHVWMPSPYDEKAYLIKDLSELIPKNDSYDMFVFKEGTLVNNSVYYEVESLGISEIEKVESFDMSETENKDEKVKK